MPGFELLGSEELELVKRVFESGAVLLRHGFDARRHGLYMTRDFETEFASQVGAPHSLAVSSATAGLTIALRALGVGPGDEVITQAFTYIATAEAIVHTGARPVIVEVDATLNMDPAHLGDAITDRTKAIIPVHMLGVPADMPPIMQIAADAGVAVIEDAAEALGARLADRDVGTWGDVGVYSFDYNKTITAGEGGMLVSTDADLIERALRYHDHGHVNDATLPRGQDRWDGLGFNYRLSEVAAAIGLAQLRKLDHIVSSNRERFEFLCSALDPQLPAALRPVPARAEPLNDCLVLQFASRRAADTVNATMADAGFMTKNVPSAIRWHFARHWSHILAPFGLDDDALARITTQSDHHLGRSVAIPINVLTPLEHLERIAVLISDACADLVG